MNWWRRLLRSMAEIHPKLLGDCIVLGRFPLCHLLLMNDAIYPWLILVPDREAINEVYQMSEADQQQLLKESVLLAKALMELFEGDKMNIAALGNVVPQCHVHHVVRYHNDPAWPAPIWGVVDSRPYDDETMVELFNKLKQASLDGFEFAEELS